LLGVLTNKLDKEMFNLKQHNSSTHFYLTASGAMWLILK